MCTGAATLAQMWQSSRSVVLQLRIDAGLGRRLPLLRSGDTEWVVEGKLENQGKSKEENE